MKKVFIYSLPRSGSTLLQRYLCRNSAFNTLSEPWIALPILYAFKKDLVFSEYEHHLFYRAYGDLEKQGLDLDKVRLNVSRSALDSYYRSVSAPEAEVFVDKTPRYTLIMGELMEIFPSDLHIVLIRHPLSCVSSMMKTFCGGQWGMYRFDIDMWKGMDQLMDAWSNDGNSLKVRYEDFVENPELFYVEVCEALGLESSNRCSLGEVVLTGSLGDPLGVKKYGGKVGKNHEVNSWVASFNTLYRRRWARKYMRNIGKNRFESLGYSYDETFHLIGSSRYSIQQELKDIPHVILSMIHKYTGIYITLVKIRKALSGHAVFGGR